MFPRARAVARRILGNASEAEDAAAEAFARALARWRHVGRLPYRDAWILRVTANVAIDMARRRERAAKGVAVLSRQPAPVPEAADRVADHLTVVAALDGLPRRQREVLALRYLAGLTEREVAGCLGVTVGTVQQHAHRGVRSLRSQLQPGFTEEAEVV